MRWHGGCGVPATARVPPDYYYTPGVEVGTRLVSFTQALVKSLNHPKENGCEEERKLCFLSSAVDEFSEATLNNRVQFRFHP